MPEPVYDESTIKSLDWKEHIRTRPGMYIGKLGDGSSQDDGIYILLKEVVDNCIDEFVMGYGKTIDIKVSGQKVTVRDYGRGIPLCKVIDCVSKINTGGKYDTVAFKKSVGLNGVGTKAVNALSETFIVKSVRDGEMKLVDYSKGEIVQDYKIEKSSLRNGTKVVFQPDGDIFKNFHYLPEYIEDQIWNYVYLNSGLNIQFNGEKYFSENGLRDLLERKTDMEKIRYPVIHLKGDDIEVALTHGDQYGEEYYSFVNGQHTTQGGTHLAAFREAVVRTMREFYKKDFDPSDIRASIIGAISIRIQNPVFESQTKTRLGTIDINEGGPTIRIFINEFIKRELDNFLHQNTDIADYLLRRIMQSERERKDMAGVKKLANQRAKKANLHNKKLRDCKVHLNDEKVEEEKRLNSTIFITEGDSASGSITKSRDVATQAVFSLRGKPLNSFGMKKKVVYENEEFNLLQHALNIEEGLENLRYNQVVVATDADVDGMHIRLLILTFFLQFFPDLVKNGHVYILETPLFRVRNKKETLYCYSDNEKNSAINALGGKPEITRFKGLGEISPEEFGLFIGESIRLEPVIIRGKTSVNDLLKYYMGKNTEDRQKFIIDNLRVEEDELEEVIG
ncbi:MAG: type IIA DNA topoisomerase subunit B [Candidatus Marinimicrobia bacterium]|nr:type IIA DNA topoisomerase subunit B [Candidatus Neomarinimicrobiota bacterium]